MILHLGGLVKLKTRLLTFCDCFCESTSIYVYIRKCERQTGQHVKMEHNGKNVLNVLLKRFLKK